jgi:hypothetical protein
MNGPKRYLRFGIIPIALTVTSLAQFGTAAAVPSPVPPVTQTQYCGNGISAVRIIPHAGFSPLSATNAQLEAEGLPDRPKEASAYNSWQRFVTHKIKYQSSCALLVNTNEYHGPQTSITPSEYNWSYSPVRAGNVATSHTYSNAEVSFQIPSVKTNNDGVNGLFLLEVGAGQSAADEQHA